MLHPFQTDTFDPGSPAVLNRIRGGQRLNEGIGIGASAWAVDGERWILLHGPYPYPIPYRLPEGFFMKLAYPLPASYGEEPHQAICDFERDWHRERLRLWALEPPTAAAPVAPPPARPAAPAPVRSELRRSPRGFHAVAVAGAVPLPGLEPWTVYGRQG